MSRQNKVNPGQYTSAGRLSPDDLGRERRRQRGKTASTGVPQGKKPAWETSSSSPKTAPSAPPGRLTVAAARTVIGVTRIAAGAVTTLTKAAKKVVGAGATRAAAAKSAKAPAPARALTAPARTTPAAKRR